MKMDGTLEVIKQVATDQNGLNISCYKGLLELMGKDRLDIIKSIKHLKGTNPSKYSPVFFADQLKDIDKLIKKYDSLYNSKRIAAEYADQEYREKKIAYDIGESDENPDDEEL